MRQYIDKYALVAEINRLIKKNELHLDENASDEVRFQKTSAYSVLCDLRHLLDTLEVKEVGYIDTFIEKACEWLENHNDYQRVLDNGRGVRFDMTQCVIDFRKAMKEE